MRAILVSVDYADLLAECLPRNRHHFSEVMVVTTPGDMLSQEVASANNCRFFTTDIFYAGGAVFNKFAAMEQALDEFGRNGLMCIMDADIIWPRNLPRHNFKRGRLYTPRRRMLHDSTADIPPESEWQRLPLNREGEFPGYSQIFHADDPVLPSPPWHETNWRHAGGADSAFQNLWPRSKKLRPVWEVLHIGESFRNWCGRSTRYRDGSVPELANERAKMVRRFISDRQRSGSFDHEKL